jgi:hypothetical protein
MIARNLLLRRIARNIGYSGLTEKIEKTLSKETFDADWAPEAQARIDDFFDTMASTSDVAASECFATICYVDLAISITEQVLYLRERGPDTPRWITDGEPGFLPFTWNSHMDEDYARLYILRDTFDPTQL